MCDRIISCLPGVRKRVYIVTIAVLSFTMSPVLSAQTWSDWWGYEGISGPEYWGKLNPEWTLCDIGKQQSPINIDPKSLVYDPNLRPFKMERKRVDGIVLNTGRDVTLNLLESKSNCITILTGPVSYRYRVAQLKIHFGTLDSSGSEHTISGQYFTAEVHLLAYNSDLYKNFTHAVHSPHGLATVAIFATIGDKPNNEFEVLSKEFQNILFKGQERNISEILLADLLPQTELYMTYEGSLTQPGCQETVTWILLNKPLYVTKDQMRALRKLSQMDIPNKLMGDNVRPTRPLNRRTIRTNINPHDKFEECTIKREMFYQVGEKYETEATADATGVIDDQNFADVMPAGIELNKRYQDE